MNIPSQQLIDEVQDLINGGKLEVADTLGISILIDFAREAHIICGKGRLSRKWINQPSTSQPHHSLHGKNVLWDGLEGTIYFLEGDVVSQQIHPAALSEGWPKT